MTFKWDLYSKLVALNMKLILFANYKVVHTSTTFLQYFTVKTIFIVSLKYNIFS